MPQNLKSSSTVNVSNSNGGRLLCTRCTAGPRQHSNGVAMALESSQSPYEVGKGAILFFFVKLLYSIVNRTGHFCAPCGDSTLFVLEPLTVRTVVVLS